MSECGKELNAYIESAASLKYHAPDTGHDIPPNHIILTSYDSYLYFLNAEHKRKSR